MLQNYSRWKVAQVFFNEPSKEHYLNEISRKSDLSHTSVKKHLEALIEDKIIEKKLEERGSREYPRYIANLENEDYKFYKKTDLISRLQETGLIDFLEEKLYPDCIVLFGSASRGEDIEESDVDLFLQSKEKDLDLTDFEEELNREIELHIREKFKELPEELKNNIANGITLHGFLEVFE